MNTQQIGLSFIPATLLSAVGVFALSAPSQALVINGGFESALTGWTTTGDVSTVGSFNSFSPPQGAAQALLNTGSSTDSEDQYSGNNPITSDVLESFLGLTSGSLGLNAAEGSGLKQTFNASLPGTLSFNWRFLGESSGFPDLAFLVVNGNQINLAQGPGFTTGLQTYSDSAFLIAGNNTIGFGVVDVGFNTAEYTGASQLLIDNVSFTASNSTAVPVPPQFLATALGAGLSALKLRRQKVTA
jgi:hypothetical protein